MHVVFCVGVALAAWGVRLSDFNRTGSMPVLRRRQPHLSPLPSCRRLADSTATIGGTTFVTTGVIGKANRDGMRQSRLLTGWNRDLVVLKVNVAFSDKFSKGWCWNVVYRDKPIQICSLPSPLHPCRDGRGF